MTLASKVSSALAPLLDLDSINSISESQLRAFNQQQQQHIVEDEGDKLRFI